MVQKVLFFLDAPSTLFGTGQRPDVRNLRGEAHRQNPKGNGQAQAGGWSQERDGSRSPKSFRGPGWSARSWPSGGVLATPLWRPSQWRENSECANAGMARAWKSKKNMATMTMTQKSTPSKILSTLRDGIVPRVCCTAGYLLMPLAQAQSRTYAP